MSIDPIPTTLPPYDHEYDHQPEPLLPTSGSVPINAKKRSKAAITAEELYIETLKANHEAEMKKLDDLSLRLVEDEERSERQWKAIMRLMKDTNEGLERTMAEVNRSTDRLGQKNKVLNKRAADKVAIAKAKR